MLTSSQTVAAIATPPGQGGIAVIRVSGPQAYQIGEAVFVPLDENRLLKNMKGYTALYGTFYHQGKALDEGIVLCFRAPHSYTGEDVLELSCHGGEVVSRLLLAACIEAGAMPAGRGEFSKRAVLNGRISLTQAEAVMDMINAATRQGTAMAEAAIAGALYHQVQAMKEKLLTLMGHLAAYIDYPEEDVETLTEATFLQTAVEVRDELASLIDGYDSGAVLRRGVRVAIIGSPNVGKSTLFNLLSGQSHAIVTPVAGTTRDVLRQEVNLGGLLLQLADTAGIHQTQDIVEMEGIRRSLAEQKQAALILAVFDGSAPLGEDERHLIESCKDQPSVALVNKSDLGTIWDPAQLEPHFSRVLVVSAATEEEHKLLAQIEEAVKYVLQVKEVDPDAAMLANDRQLSAAVWARDSLNDACSAISEGYALDAAGVCLEDALRALASLSGEDVTAAVVDEVFSKFCVGK